MITKMGEWEPSELKDILYVKNLKEVIDYSKPIFRNDDEVTHFNFGVKVLENDLYPAWYRAYVSLKYYIDMVFDNPRFLDDDLFNNNYTMARIILYSETYDKSCNTVGEHPSSIRDIFMEYFGYRHADYNLIILRRVMKYYAKEESDPIKKILGLSCYNMIDKQCNSNIIKPCEKEKDMFIHE